MSSPYETSGLAEVLRRPCSRAAQPREYHSTIRPVEFSNELREALGRDHGSRSPQPLPRPVGVVNTQVATRRELRNAAVAIISLASRSANLKAPSGVGKSTVLPWELHCLTECVVVVMSPNEVIAQAHVQETLELGYNATYVSPTRMSVTPLKKMMGVVYTTAAGMIMRALSAKKDMTDMEAPLYVVHDESHFVDADGHFFRTMWPDFSSVKKVISVTTYGPEDGEGASASAINQEGSLTGTVPGPTVVAVPFCEESAISPSDRLPNGELSPWAVENMRHKKTLLYVESDRIAGHIAATYGEFVTTCQLRRHDPYSQFQKMRALLENQPPEGLLIITDSAHQYGYKFPVDQIVDFGCVRQTTAGAGLQPVDRVLRENAIEQMARVNSAAQSGPNTSPVVAYVADAVPANVEPGMNADEVPKIAAYCKLFGYEPPEAALPRRDVDKFEVADHVEFLRSGLPWDVWVKRDYKQRPIRSASSIHAPHVSRNDVQVAKTDVSNVLDWLGTQRLEVTPVALKSGQSYKDAQGFMSADARVLERIEQEAEDSLKWLRDKLRGSSVRQYADYTDDERYTIWLVWLSAWNENVADLIALDKWRAEYGDVVNTWRVRVDCRGDVARLLATAREVHDKWVLLSEWYRTMFAVSPYALTEADTDSKLVDNRYRAIVEYLGRREAQRSVLGSTSVRAGLSYTQTRRMLMDTHAVTSARYG